MYLSKRLVGGLVLGSCLGLFAAACGPKSTPTAEPPTAAPVAFSPRLTVLKPTVQFREREMDPSRDLQSGDAIDVMPGANIIVRDNGRAVLTWTGFLTHELLTDTDTLLSLSQPDQRYVVLDQATGTARYTLEGVDQPANLQVKAGAIVDVQVAQGEADFVVSLLPVVVTAGEGSPTGEPSAWVVMLKGTATITRTVGMADGGTAPAEQAQSVTLTAGQAAAFTKSGPMPEPLDVDVSTVAAWYNDVAEGTAKVSIASVAFRCKVTADSAKFLAAPDAKAQPAGDPLPAGTLLNILQRDMTGGWLRGVALAGTEKGWVSAKDVACLGPVANLGASGPGEAPGVPTATVPLPTRRPLSVVGTPTRTPTPAVTATRTPTAGPVEIDFRAEPSQVEEGKCARLIWSVSNIREVYLDEGGVAGEGEKRVCPNETTSYTLRVVMQDGTERSDTVTVKVVAKEQPTAAVEPTETTAPTRELPTSEPPTEQPTPEPPQPTTAPVDTPTP